MKTFSFTRMLMLSRLQFMEIYGRHPKKTLTIASSAIIALSLLALIINGWRLGDSMEAAEHLTYIFAAVLSMAFYADLVANRLMVPASNAEKFAALYTNMLLITIISVLLTATVGSAFFSIVSMFIDDADNGAVILFFRKGHSSLLYFIFMGPIFIWLTQFAAAKKRYGKAAFWSVIAGYTILMLLPVLLQKTGMTGEDTARVLSACIGGLVLTGSVVWSYILLKKTELDSREND